MHARGQAAEARARVDAQLGQWSALLLVRDLDRMKTMPRLRAPEVRSECAAM
jgi:hypothetical protein